MTPKEYRQRADAFKASLDHANDEPGTCSWVKDEQGFVTTDCGVMTWNYSESKGIDGLGCHKCARPIETNED